MTSTIKERPILFSGPMVRAILEGRKTATRRIVKGGQIPKFNGDEPEHGFRWSAVGQNHPRYGYIVHGETEELCAAELGAYGVCPHGKPGDRLWVREAWRTVAGADDIPPRNLMNVESFTHYEADGATASMGKLRPSMFMPRWACRILLEITAVRVERLQGISPEQAVAEGILCTEDNFGNGPAYCDYGMADLDDTAEWFNDPVLSFQSLWASINGAKSWNANPWVWVVEFKRVTP